MWAFWRRRSRERQLLEIAVGKLCDIQEMVTIMSAELDNLKAAVAKNSTVEGSAIVLLKGLKAKLDAMVGGSGGVDAQAVADLAAELGAQTDSLARAITENTPVENPAPAPKE